MVSPDLEDKVPVDSANRNWLADYGGAGILYCLAGLSVLLLPRFDSSQVALHVPNCELFVGRSKYKESGLVGLELRPKSTLT